MSVGGCSGEDQQIFCVLLSQMSHNRVERHILNQSPVSWWRCTSVEKADFPTMPGSGLSAMPQLSSVLGLTPRLLTEFERSNLIW